ncbi:MAG: hypothetical protein EBW98_07500 [Actinobacteria bacterium]|nr:hypothetical protein [Actinomycetota bacterium]
MSLPQSSGVVAIDVTLGGHTDQLIVPAGRLTSTGASVSSVAGVVVAVSAEPAMVGSVLASKIIRSPHAATTSSEAITNSSRRRMRPSA